MSIPLVLLGPQRSRPTAGDALRELGLEGPVATITAGWQEHEAEDSAVQEALGVACSNLALYRRAERVFDRDPELFAAHRRRQERLKELQRLYRRRLDHALAAYRELEELSGDGPALVEERRDCLAVVRALDRHHLEGVRSCWQEYDDSWPPLERDAVSSEHREIAGELEEATALVIAGGHVAVLLNRMRLFGLSSLIAGKPILAWSGGAMVLGERVVLFYDRPPWGAGNAELLDEGLGVFSELVLFPDVRRRLDLDDAARVGRLARRLAPRRCVGLDEGSRVVRRGGVWSWEAVPMLPDGGEPTNDGAEAVA